jgi:nucleoside-diphosphate-sugar epimerase
MLDQTCLSRTVMITGGAGAIGSRLVRRLLRDSFQKLIVIDDLSSGYEWLLPDDSRIQFVREDVCRLCDLDLSADKPVIFHLAAFFANQNSVDNPVSDLHTNGRGTLTTLLWAEKSNARTVVYASAGCSIAGHGIDGPICEDMPVSLNLDTPYQITKALGEFYCNYFHPRVPAVRCRFFNSYGPGEVPGYYRNVIPNFIWKAMHGLPLTITGTGDETRDFIYVDDLVDGLVRSAAAPEAAGGAFNLGTGIQTRIGDLAEWIIAACRSRSRIEFGSRRSWDNSTHRQADISRARNLLGFAPTVNVREGIGRTVEWFEANKPIIEEATSASMGAIA